eukprot:8419627-Pyramimonas_sp.AAC.1
MVALPPVPEPWLGFGVRNSLRHRPRLGTVVLPARLRHRSLLGALVRRAVCITDRSWRLWAFL